MQRKLMTLSACVLALLLAAGCAQIDTALRAMDNVSVEQDGLIFGVYKPRFAGTQRLLAIAEDPEARKPYVFVIRVGARAVCQSAARDCSTDKLVAWLMDKRDTLVELESRGDEISILYSYIRDYYFDALSTTESAIDLVEGLKLAPESAIAAEEDYVDA